MGHGAGHGNDAAQQWLAVQHGAGHGVQRAHVQALHAQVCGARAVRHLDPGKDADQLLGAATGVFGGDAYHAVGRAGAGGLHGGDGVRFVVFDADQHLACLQRVRGNADAVHNAGGALAHQHVVAADKGFALGAVHHQGGQRAGTQLEVGGEHRAAQANHAHVLQVAA